MDELYLEYYATSIGIASKLAGLIGVLLGKSAQKHWEKMEIYNYTRNCIQYNWVNICINELNVCKKGREYTPKRIRSGLRLTENAKYEQIIDRDFPA